jgi:acetyl-CoA carboxylase carboxyl transferase subunit beta
MIDMVVHRHDLRHTIGSLAAMLMRAETPAGLIEAPPPRPAPETTPVLAYAEGDEDLLHAPVAGHAE